MDGGGGRLNLVTPPSEQEKIWTLFTQSLGGCSAFCLYCLPSSKDKSSYEKEMDNLDSDCRRCDLLPMGNGKRRNSY